MNDNSAHFHSETDDIFGRIAKDYDRYCDYFSFYIQRLWKRRFVEAIACESGKSLLDLASGTGDIPLRLLGKSTKRDWHITVSDISVPMLDVARQKLRNHPDTVYAILNACHMPQVPDNHYDIITMAFGMKIIDRTPALDEIYRCLKPGGVFLCVEASRIPLPWLHRLYLSYMDFCLPVIGRIVSKGDASSYDYLLRGIHGFPDRDSFSQELVRHGFSRVEAMGLSLGIVAIHVAHKPL